MSDFEEKFEYRVSYYADEIDTWHTIYIAPNEPLAKGIVEYEQKSNPFGIYKIEQRLVRYYEWTEIE